ncbi:MAG: epimerase [Burkholderiales bacterium]|nr:epimerase [Burkholderiales bacterium]
MRVVLFGATGMVGQGVLGECLKDAAVSQVVCVGRTPLGLAHPKCREVVAPDLFELGPFEDQLRGLDACFFCLGVSSNGLSEASYRRLTYDLTLSVASRLARLNPALTFVYVSGTGTDSSERGGVMWARVKGATENALLRLPFKSAFMFRPGIIVPLDGIRSKTPSYRFFYSALGPVLRGLQRLMPRSMNTTRSIGRAMLAVARHGAPSPLLGPAEIEAAAAKNR